MVIVKPLESGIKMKSNDPGIHRREKSPDLQERLGTRGYVFREKEERRRGGREEKMVERGLNPAATSLEYVDCTELL